MRNDLTPFRTVRELLENSDCVLMGNAVNTEGKLYDDSVENLTAILAMQDSYNEMLAALEAVTACLRGFHAADDFGPLDDEAVDAALEAITKAKGN
jgi:hypothetical protein